MKKLNCTVAILTTLFLFSILTSCSCGQNAASSQSDDEAFSRTNTNNTTTIHKNVAIPNKKENLNISILLDLSDRINPKKYPMPGMDIYQRDLGYIESVSDAFEKHLKGSRIRQADDYMQVFFEPEPMNQEINMLANSMKMAFDKNNISKTAIAKISGVYAQSSAKIYQLALQDKNFVGSDIWTFFKNKVKDYCIKPQHRNLLVILTDGYLFHQDNKIREGNKSTYLTPEFITAAKLNVSSYQKLIEARKFGFIPATDHLEDLEVLVLGINPEKGKNFEGDVIKKYWSDWLTAMGVKKYNLKGADLPSNLEPVIRDIINN
jgi:hypothetical protein